MSKKAIVHKGEHLLVLDEKDGGSMMHNGAEMIVKVDGWIRFGLFRCILPEDPDHVLYLHVEGEGREWKRHDTNNQSSRFNKVELNCQRCKAPKTIAMANFLGDKARLSGYEPVMRSDTSVIWLCPVCVEFLCPHIQAIFEVVGRHIYWPHLVSFLDPKPKKEGL
jgi:hypothetical protein